MRMSGRIRRKEGKLHRPAVCRPSPRLAALPDGTTTPGSEGHYTGPGLIFSADHTEVVHTVLNYAAPGYGVSSYLIPLEQKSRRAAARRNFHE